MPINKKIVRFVNRVSQKQLDTDKRRTRTIEETRATLHSTLAALEECKTKIRGAIAISGRSGSLIKGSKAYAYAIDFVNRFNDSVIELSDELYLSRRSFKILPKADDPLDSPGNNPIDLMHEISSLQSAFPCGTGYSLKHSEIWVITPEITLQAYGELVDDDIKVCLGQFKIILKFVALENGSRHKTYHIESTRGQQYASKQGRYIHPHIDNGNGTLCAGEGGSAIAQALNSNRIVDFFEIVTSILSTYNGESPYFPLEQWYKLPCHGCNEFYDEDDLVGCEKHPQSLYCIHCTTSCHCCEEDANHCCLTYCRSCDERSCDDCFYDCKTPSCTNRQCQKCIEEGYCPKCFRRIQRRRELRKQKRDSEAGKLKEEEHLHLMLEENPSRTEEYVRELLELPAKE